MKYHALISEAGNFDFVAADLNFQDQIDGRFSVGSFDDPEDARRAIAHHRATEEYNNEKFVEQNTAQEVHPEIRA